MPTASQHTQSGPLPAGDAITRRLILAYTVATALYLGTMAVLAKLGVEAIGGHTFPFYARYLPCYGSYIIPAGAMVAAGAALFASRGGSRNRPLLAMVVTWGVIIAAVALALLAQQGADRFPLARGLRTAWLWYRWHVAAGVLIVAWLAMVNRVMAQPESGESSSRSTVLMLLCLTLFVMAFPVAIAGVRGGWASISEAYTRAPVEYIGDIGKGGTIRGLFREYLAMHGDLSLHSKVHPPGPVAILWLLSYVVGRGPLALSLATAAVAALAVVPLYLWGRDLAGRRVGITCVSLYALMPSIVLFTATSADILFMPFSITTLWLFDRALRRGSWAYAVSAGVCYGLLGLLSFNLLTLGAYFAFAGLLHVRTPGGLARVVRTAATMVAAFCTVHGVVYAWSGFDIVACFHASKAQFDLDQIHVTVVEGRWPAWTWKIVNPACWFYFAGIPISLLFIRRLAKPQGDTKPLFIVFALTFLAINLLYLARGEGERSAMYVLPFVVLPAAHRLDELVRRQGSARPLVATLASLGFLCWLTELHFDTYW